MLEMPEPALDDSDSIDSAGIIETTPLVLDGAIPVSEEAGVGLTPRTTFGRHRGHGSGMSHHEKKAAEEQEKILARQMGIVSENRSRKRGLDMGRNCNVPRELRMASHPMYVAEPPDVLYIEALQLLPNRPVAGERLIRQDGTISLGYYGQLHVAGLMLHEIEEKIRQRLSEYVNDPEVYVDVAAFNSKVYYVVGQVQQAGRLPITGKETVLDAVSLAGGLTNYAENKKIHLARPNPGGGCDQILWVDWHAITYAGDTRTNYQLLPGDRVVVPSTGGFRLSVLADNILPPFERLAGLGALIRFATR